MYINKAQILGNITKDPELKSLPSGIKVTSVSMATNRKYTSNGEKKEDTEFHNIIAFGKVAEIIAQYAKKGSPLYVEGRIQTRSWETEGVKKYRTEIIVENFQFGPRASSQPTEVVPVEKPKVETKSLPDDYPEEESNLEDIPF